MKNIEFAEIASIVNRSGFIQIGEASTRDPKGRWALYTAVSDVPGTWRQEFQILYLSSEATIDSIRDAQKELSDFKKVQVVYAASLAKRLPTFRNHLDHEIRKVASAPDYLRSFISGQLSKYLQSFNIPPNFVQPAVQTPAGFTKKVPNSLVAFLRDDETLAEGKVAILLAEPGQGKTYMTKAVAGELKQSQHVPIYISSEQWTQMRPEDLASIGKTILHSFRFFEAPISWVEGYEDEFISTALKLDLFKIVFDGLDEYILWNRGAISIEETLSQLAELAKETTAKILVTSRTSFWKAMEEQPDVFVYMLQPFDANHAAQYFSNRLAGEPSKQDMARQLFKELQNSAKGPTERGLVGRGFVLTLLADLADKGSGTKSRLPDETITQWLTRLFCEREVERQKLPISAPQQVEIFKELAVEGLYGSPTSELLRLCIESTVPLSPKQVDDLVGAASQRGKLYDHPILKHQNGLWAFVQEQVRMNLIAERLFERCHSDGALLQDRAFFELHRGSFVDDLASTCVEIAVAKHDRPTSEKEIRLLISKLVQDERTYLGSRSLAGCVAYNATNSFEPIGGPKSDRAQLFASLFPKGIVQGAEFEGTLSSLDLRGVMFADCTFRKATFVNSLFDASTVFEDCEFIGGMYSRSEGISDVTIKGGELDEAFRALMNAEKVSTGAKKYSADDLKSDTSQVLRKFAKGTIIKSVSEGGLNRGVISLSVHRDEIIQTLLKYVIETHHLPGTNTPGYNVREDAKQAFQFFAGNGVFTGPIDRAYRELCEKLKLV